MCGKERVNIRGILLGIIGLILIVLLFKTNTVYAGGITFDASNLEVYRTKEFFVSNETRKNDWSVYTELKGKNPNNNIVRVTKKTDRGYTRIECKALNAGTVRIYVRDGITGAVCYKDIKVTRRDITKSCIDLSQTNYTYNNSEKKPKVNSVKLNGVKICNYKVRYENNIKAGTATVYVDGLGNNCGTACRKFTINKRSIVGGKIKLYDYKFTYCGKEYKPAIKEVTINNGKTTISDYSVTYKNNIKVGTATVIVTGKGSNTGQITRDFIIDKRDISNARIELDYDECIYDDTSKKPGVKVYLSRSRIDDINVEYKNNVKAGTATVLVTGKGGNKGALTTTFKIKKRNISKATITLNKDTFIYDGNEKKPSVTVKLGKVTIKKDISINYYNNVNVGTATVTVKGLKDNEGSVSKSFKIIKSLYATVKNESGNGYTKVAMVDNKKYKIFNQGMFRGNIPSEGCSITSEAIVLSGYGKNKTPNNIANDVSYYPRTIAEIANDLTKYGVPSKYKSISPSEAQNSSNRSNAKNEIKSNLEKGKPIILLLHQGTDNRYTSDAHYVVLVGLDKNGNPAIANPNGGLYQNSDNLDTLINNYMYYYGRGGGERGYVIIK